MSPISGNKLNIILKIPLTKKEVVENYHNTGFFFSHHKKDGCGGKTINTVGVIFILWAFYISY